MAALSSLWLPGRQPSSFLLTAHQNSHADLVYFLPVIGIIQVLYGIAIVGSLLNRGDAGGKADSLSPSPVPEILATPEPFLDSQFWPNKVRISKPVTFSGKVGNGIIKLMVAAGRLLTAIPSTDHQSVILHNLDLMERVPISETDFLERSHKYPKEETPSAPYRLASFSMSCLFGKVLGMRF